MARTDKVCRHGQLRIQGWHMGGTVSGLICTELDVPGTATHNLLASSMTERKKKREREKQLCTSGNVFILGGKPSRESE